MRIQLLLPETGLRSLIPMINGLEVYFTGNLEIEPYVRFSAKYSSAYWHTKYQLTQSEFFRIDEDNRILFEDSNTNPIWLNITDQNTFTIMCTDGDKWVLEKFGVNKKLDDFFAEGNIKYQTTGNTG